MGVGGVRFYEIRHDSTHYGFPIYEQGNVFVVVLESHLIESGEKGKTEKKYWNWFREPRQLVDHSVEINEKRIITLQTVIYIPL